MTRAQRLLLVSALTFGCRNAGDPPTTIPRYRDHPESFETGLVGGLNYDPEDAPIAWQPDGGIVVAHRERYTLADVLSGTCSGSGVFLVPAAGGPARPLAVGKPVCDAWSESGSLAVDPAGAWVIYAVHTRSRGTRLVRLDLASGTVDSLRACRVSLGHPAVSRDGSLVAAIGVCGNAQSDWAAYVFRADGSAFHEVARMRTLVQATPAWSPDNGRLALQRRGDMAVVDLRTGEARAIGQGVMPSWSPDGEWIAFYTADRDTVTVQIVHPDGSGGREVFRTRERRTYRRGWGPRPAGGPEGLLVWSPDSKHVAFSRRFDEGTSVWRIEIASGALRQVTQPDRR